MFLGFGQWEWATTLTTTAYRPIEEQASSLKASSIFPALENIVSGAASVAGKYLQLLTTKEQAKTVQQQLQARTVTGAVAAPVKAGFDLGSSWPILGIIGIGAFLVLRGGKGKGIQRRKRRKR